MRVLMFAWEFPPNMVGGLGKHVVELLPELVDEDVEVHLITPRLKGDAHEGSLVSANTGKPATNNSTYYRVDVDTQQTGSYYDYVAQTNIALGAAANDVINRVGEFDLIHAHDWLVSFAAIALKNARHLPLLTTIHATEMGRTRGQLKDQNQHNIHSAEWQLAYESWRIIACSHFMDWEIQTYFGAPDDKIDVIPNGVDTTPFDRLNSRDLLGWRDSMARRDEKIVFYVGRLQWEKGLQVLVDAAPEIISIYPSIRFIIAGSGDLRRELAKRAADLGVAQWFSFPGRISDDDRDRLYKVADCAVFPSLYEPFGIVALEGMAANTPVVVSDVGGLSEVVALHKTGIKVHPDDPHSLAWGVLHTLLHPKWSRQRTENAYREVKKLYNWDLIAKMTVQTYNEVVAQATDNEWAYFGSRRPEPKLVVKEGALTEPRQAPVANGYSGANGESETPIGDEADKAADRMVGASGSRAAQRKAATRMDPPKFDPRLER